MIIWRDAFYSPTSKIRKLHIHLPDDYYTSDQQYPVMYFFDGHNLYRDEDSTYGQSWGLESFLNQWKKPMIVVGIECGHEDGERLQDYCPYECNDTFLGSFSGIGDQTMEWIVNDLKLMIDMDFRTYYFREATGIAGASMGGLMALYGAVRYNRWFSKAACLSPTLLPFQQQMSNEISSSSISPDTKIYLSWGSGETGIISNNEGDFYRSAMGECNMTMANQLREKFALTKTFCQMGGQHCEADWKKQISRFMDFLWF